MSDKSFSVEDLRRWQRQGLLSDDQLESILVAEGLESEPQAKERKAGLNAVTIAYYFGSILAFFSFTFFIGMSWGDISDWAQMGIALGAMLLSGALGFWFFFRRGYPTAGGLLLFVATATFPLFIHTIANIMGIWPDKASFHNLRFALLYLSLVSLPVPLFMLALIRFSLISLVAAGLIHLVALAIADIASYDSLTTTAVTCGCLALVGIALTLLRKKHLAFWFKLYGLIGLQIGFTYNFIESDSVFLGLLFLLVYLSMIGLSLYFREIIYLVFGAIGSYTYFVKLVFDTFRGTDYFSVLLGVIGLSIVVVAVLYQRYGVRFFKRGA